MDIAQLRDAIVNETRCIELARASVHVAMANPPNDVSPEAWRLTRENAELIAAGNIRQIFVHAESELEKLFLGSLALVSIHTNPFSFVFTPASASVREAITTFCLL